MNVDHLSKLESFGALLRVISLCMLSLAAVANASVPELPPGSKVYATLHSARFGRNYTIVLYTSAADHGDSATVLVYDPSLPAGQSTLLSEKLPGNSFGEPTGLMDLLRRGYPQIVVYGLVGASCEGVLHIYDFDSPVSIADLSKPWANTCQNDVEIKDLSHDGVPEITFNMTTRDPIRAVYRWDGTEYKRDDAAFPAVNDRAVQELISGALSTESLPLSARMQWFNEVIPILIEEHRTGEALNLCSSLRRVIRNPQTTTPDTRLTEDDPALNERILTYHAVDVRNFESSILKTMGDLYKLEGNTEKAQQSYRQADELLRDNQH